MKKRIFFTFTYFIFAIIIFVLASRTSLAFGDDCIYVGPSGGEDTRTGCELHRIRECRIKLEEIKEEILLEEDIYDTNNNFLGKGLLIKDKYKFVAGRFIGVDAYEKHIITYVVSITPICLEPNCKHVQDSCWTRCGGACCGGDECNGCISCKMKVSECRDKADAYLKELVSQVDTKPSVEAKRQDVNDINKGHIGENPTITVELSKTSVDYGSPEPSDRESKYVSQTVIVEHTYNLTPAWINPKTGEVKYEPSFSDDIDEGVKAITEQEKKEYMKVPEMYTTRLGDQIRIGQYFVPLNAKSTDLLRYYLIPNSDPQKSPLGKEMCSSLIEKYSQKKDNVEHWSDFMYDIYRQPLKNRANTTAEALNIVEAENGCRLGLNIDFRIAQGFYNEVTEIKKGIGGDGTSLTGKVQTSIKGYNFYYRPIDYRNPFPNGLTDNSYWIDVYNKDSNAVTVENASGHKLDLDDSFAQVTYATNKDYDVTVIRKYNSQEDNKYSSMTKINNSGTSTFISQNYGVTRYACETYYALGCGPANSDWEECKIRQTGVCKQ